MLFRSLAAVTCATETSSVVRSVTCCAKVCGKGAVEGTQSATFRFANWARVPPAIVTRHALLYFAQVREPPSEKIVLKSHRV